MRRRKAAKTQRPNTLKRHNAPKVTRHRKPLAADANERVAQLTRERDEALEQQTATSEVLKVISSSRAQLKPVFETIVDRTTRICGATFSCLGLFEENALRFAAISGASADSEFFHPERLHQPYGCPYVIPLARAKSTVQTADLRAERGYVERDPFYVTAADVGGARTVLRVPLLKDGILLGHLWAFRQEVLPFSDKQIALVQNFAAQAVIAIENTRLLNDLNKLNRQLEQRVADQVSEIERMSRLRRFLSPQVADLIVASGAEKQLENVRSLSIRLMSALGHKRAFRSPVMSALPQSGQ
jgi:GAF domain-containing protein